ncbi:unnamed protein product [Caenorhabditis brenneri]
MTTIQETYDTLVGLVPILAICAIVVPVAIVVIVFCVVFKRDSDRDRRVRDSTVQRVVHAWTDAHEMTGPMAAGGAVDTEETESFLDDVIV